MPTTGHFKCAAGTLKLAIITITVNVDDVTHHHEEHKTQRKKR